MKSCPPHSVTGTPCAIEEWAHGRYPDHHGGYVRGWWQHWMAAAVFQNMDLSEHHHIDTTGGQLS